MTCSYRKGFISLPLWGYAAVAAGVVFLGMGIALKVQTSRLDACKDEYSQFVAEVKAKGEAAQKAAQEQELKDKKAKEKADHENAVNRKRIADLTKRLRERPAGSGVPAAPAGSRRPDLACFDRAEFERAYGTLVARLRELADEGTAATIDLDTAKEWASPRP